MHRPQSHPLLIALAAFALLVGIPAGLFAHSFDYIADLLPLNNSGVNGRAFVTHDEHNDTLKVTIRATGLEARRPHAQHIHGQLGGLNGTVPTVACCDADRDGFVEVLEGAKAYGPVLLNLTSPPGAPGAGHGGDHGGVAAFPTAPNGVINFGEIYNLNDPKTFAGLDPPLGANTDKTALFPLENRHIVIHGLTVGAGFGTGTDGEVDGTSGYKAVLPVPNGELVRVIGPNGLNGGHGGHGSLNVVPEPTSVVLLGSDLIGLGWVVQRRQRRQ